MDIEKIKKNGYIIENAKITSADLSMEDHGCLTFYMGIDGKGWGCNYGGYCLGHGYIGAKEFDGCPKGIEYIMRIMDTVGVSKLSDLSGKYVRVASKGWGSSIKIIGNIIEDKWFDTEGFFNSDKGSIDENENN